MRAHVIFRYTGFALLFNAVFLFISAMVSALQSDGGFMPLLYSGLLSLLFGLFPLIFVPPSVKITNKEGFIIVVASWLISCLIGTLPYILWGGEFTFTNAWFESVSGFTTTGSSILTDVEAVPDGLLFWRSSTHWIGGMGIIIFVLSVLPSLGKVGMILYRSEISSLATENFHLRTRRALQILASVYVGLTVAQTLLLLACGLGLLDAVTHAFSTIATGGFSTKNLSIAHFRSLPVEIVTIAFMVLSGMHFGLLFSLVTGKAEEILRSPIVKYYLAALGAGILLVTLSLHGRVFQEWGESVRYGAFQVITVGTSTGFATADSAVWPALAQLILFFFILQCACAGSTSGGIKADRIVIFFKTIRKRITQIQHPSAVLSVRVGRATIHDDLIEVSILYISLYIFVVFVSAVLLTAMGVDLLTAFSGSAATMGNVGPGFGGVGSMGNFSSIPELGKWVLSADMLIGRLEVFGIVVLFTRNFWK